MELDNSGQESLTTAIQRRPRTFGLLVVGAGLAAIGANCLFILLTAHFLSFLNLMGGIAIPFGFWIVVTGWVPGKTKSKRATRWRAIAIPLMFAGLAAGLYFTMWLGSGR